MTTKDRLKQILAGWKFPVRTETETSLVFRYQMNYVQANITDGDDVNAIAITLSGIFSADDERVMRLALRTCNDLNYHLLQAKFYIDSDCDLMIAAEFFHRSPEDLEYLALMALQTLVAAKKRFLQKYSELDDEGKLASQLDQN